MKEFPEGGDLPALRKGLRRRKLPLIKSGMGGRCGFLGSFLITQKADGFYCEWQKKGGREKSASFMDLCTKPELELDRLELGWLMAELYALDAEQMMSHVGHPLEAFRVASAPLKAEEDWRHWAIVKPGHMNGL